MNKIENIIKQDRLDPSIKKSVILYKGEIFTYFDSGLTRYVFVNEDKTKVIKICIETTAFEEYHYNVEENGVYQRANDTTKKQMAKTLLTQGGAVIEQEFCNPIKYDSRNLSISQILFAESCRNEVGWTLDGRLVCFDLDEFKKY